MVNSATATDGTAEGTPAAESTEEASGLELTVAMKVNKSFSEEGEQLDEVFVTSDKPYLNYKFNLDGEQAGVLKSGHYTIQYTQISDAPAGAVDPTIGETILTEQTGTEGQPSNVAGSVPTKLGAEAGKVNPTAEPTSGIDPKVSGAPARDLSKNPKPVV